MEIRFQNKLKFHQHYFERMIEDQNNSFKLQLNKVNEELKQAKNTIADLKGQLKVAQKDNKSRDPQSHNIKIASTQTIANEKLAKVPTHSLITDPVNTQSADTKDNSSISWKYRNLLLCLRAIRFIRTYTTFQRILIHPICYQNHSTQKAKSNCKTEMLHQHHLFSHTRNSKTFRKQLTTILKNKNLANNIILPAHYTIPI